MAREHRYEVTVAWTGNTGTGTSGYADYRRTHEVQADGKPAVPGSADPAFRGEPDRWNPEELLVASLAQCHMLWYLHLCAVNKVVVTDYVDRPVGTMQESTEHGGRFVEVVLRPRVTVAAAEMVERAASLHEQAHRHCFIANSVNFPVRHQPTVAASSGT